MSNASIGFIKDMPNETYHALDGVSKSGLDKIDRSPAHFKYSEQKDSTRAMEVGTAIHAAILEPVRFDKEYCITECKARTEKAYKEAKAIHGGELTLTKQEGEKVMNMCEAVHGNLDAMKQLAAPGDAELSAICIDPETGVQLRARYDWLNENRIAVDVKKTQDIRKFGKTVETYRYHVQEAVYRFVYKQITGEDLQHFYFLAVEEEAPHSNEMFLLDETMLEIGNYYFRKNLRTYADCLDSGKWPHPNFGDGIIEPSNWELNTYENNMEVML